MIRIDMKTVLIALMFLAGIIFVISVMLMSPKGGLGLGIGGVSSSNEYGSKKSIESTLKKVALVTGIIFAAIVLYLPYAN